MRKEEAESLIDHLSQSGFQAGLGYEAWPDGYSSWYVLVETRQGHLYHLLTPEAVVHFIEHDGPEEVKIATQRQRYLQCRACGLRFSANPEHYHGWAGWLSHCGRAVQLWQRNPEDEQEYLLADLVDHPYLKQPHSDAYALHSPLPYHGSQLYVGVAKEETLGTPVRPPRIPDAPRQPVEKLDYGWLGFIMYEAGYKRQADGVWRATFTWNLSADKDYTPFEEGDRIQYETERAIPFTSMQVHRSPNYWNIRFTEEQAA
jgi:hypothetical protein